MHFSRKGVYVAAVLILMSAVPLWAQDSTDAPKHAPSHWLPDYDWSGQWCRYPIPKARTKTSKATSRVAVLNEVEPNDLFANAQEIEIAPEPMAPLDIDLKGTVNDGEDQDLYRFTGNKGDIIGLAVLAQASLNPVLSIEQSNQIALITNDDWAGVQYLIPPQSPMPVGVGLYDSAMTWTVPANGEYLIRVCSYVSASRGDYTLQIRARRPSFESQEYGATQIIFLDFDGASINAEQIFGYPARNPANLSPLRDFLTRWGLTAEDEATVVQMTVETVQETFDALRVNTLNGNRDTDNTAGHFDVQILNSRDHADPWGQPNASRVIVGGTMEQLGIATIGLAQSIDPGNFDREETAVVLLDLLSEDAALDIYDLSINSIGLDSSLTKAEAVGRTLGKAIAHEAGHYLGNWHTDPLNEIPCIMDAGGGPTWILAGAGPDGYLGTPDDQLIDFVIDSYIPDPEQLIAVGEQATDTNTAFAMSTGRVQRETTPETPTWPYPLTAVRASPTTGAPPLQVEFSAGAIDDDAKDITFTWDFTDGSPAASGPVVSHVFETPGQFLVKVTASNSQGVKGQATVLVTVSATLPTASLVASPLRGAAPLNVSFDASGSSAPAGDIIKYEWDLGDGTTASGAQVQHSYTGQGYYAAKLTVTDSYGGTSTATVLITVNAPLEVYDSTQTVPTTQTAAPQCGLGSGVTMLTSLSGLVLLMGIRRRH